MAHQRQAPRRAAQHQNTFFGGAAILAVGIFVVKIIGMFYKIPLLNIIGEEGSADFTNAYNIYAVLLTISTAGLPVAVSKLVSEANALGRRRQVDKVFRISLGAFLLLGVLSFLVMFFGADQLAALMNDSLAAPGIRALSPAVICVGCLAALRGYAQGHSNMTSTSVSQIIEALCKLVVGLALAAYVMQQVFTAADLARYLPGLDPSAMTAKELAEAVGAAQTSQAAAGAIVGVTVGT
ncbi:MAG: oligosaccharide flippase family protein, partial [Lawsonibacter sp.]